MMQPASPSKKAKSSCLFYTLLAVVVAIILCGVVITWLTVFRPTTGDGPDVDFQNATHVATSSESPITTTTIGSTSSATTTQSSTTMTTSAAVTSSENTEVSSESPTTSVEPTTTTTTTPTTTTTAPEIVLPVDVASILQEKNKEFAIVAECSRISALPVTCQPSATPTSSLNSDDPAKFRPIHYTLNMTIRDIRKPVLEGHLQLFAETKRPVQAISLHAARIHNMDNPARIHVVNCETGETICVSRVHHIGDVAHLELAHTVDAGLHLRIDVDAFISADAGPHVYKQIPTAKWRVPQMMGTIFEPASARHVFPSFDLHNEKASFSLCLDHGVQMTAVSNSLLNQNVSTPGISCFEKTVPLTAQQMGFVVFERTNPLFYNSTTLDGAFLPEIEMILNLNTRNFKSQQYEWVHSEVTKVMALMSKYSAFSYPLSRLELVVAPVTAGHSALGVITLPAQAIAYQKHTSTHETLIKEVIGQWMEGVVTTEHTCFEKALIAYLEWKINEELQIVKKTRKMEVSRIRPRNLNETTDQMRVIRQIASPSTHLCSPRFVEVFYTLDETYGQDTVIGMIRVIFDKFAFATATIADWSSAAESATGRPETAALVREWFRESASAPSSAKTRPVLRAVVSSHGVEFHQLTDEIWTVPLEISGSGGTQLAVISEKRQTIPFVSSDYVVVDANRKSHAFVVYDADTYLRLIRCFADSRCPSKEVGGIFSDLGAALLANILPKPENQEVAKWKSVFKFMAQQNLVEGTAACCVEHAIREMRKCSYWDIQDVCTKIDFNSVLAAVA